MKIRVSPITPKAVGSLRKLLEEALRDGEPFPSEFVERLRGAVTSGVLEILVASVADRTVGVAVVAYRPSISAAADFASVEEVHVLPGERGKGVGRALLEAVERQCTARGVSYIEAQTDDEAMAFYTACGYEEEPDVRVMSRSAAL